MAFNTADNIPTEGRLTIVADKGQVIYFLKFNYNFR